MDALWERFLDLQPRDRVVAIVGAVAALFFLYAYFLYWPRNATIADRETQLEQRQAEKEHKAAMVANIEKTRREVQELDGDLKKAVAELPDTKEIPDLLSNVSSLGRESGLEIIQFKQRPEEYEEFYAVVPVSILVRGAYHQVATFFDKVGRMARIVNVSDVAVKGPAKLEGDPVVLETACVATTFRFLDETERERIAKMKAQQKEGRK